MSSEGFHRRRRIQKLDFENCIVTNDRTKTRGRKKLRARIIRQIEDVQDDDDVTTDAPPVPTQGSPARVQTSPVLIRRPPGDRESPAVSKRKKVCFSGEKAEESRCPSSPVFKLLKRNKTLRSQPFESSSSSNSSSMENSYQIDETASQESKESVRISSVESTEVKESSTRGGRNGSLTVVENWGGRKAGKRSHKKNSLLGRLQKLQQKQSSEKLLWQHQRRKNPGCILRLSVLNFWKDDVRFFLKCRSSSADLGVTFLVVDSRWVPQLRKVKQASILQLHPPWQRVAVEEYNASVLVNVICLDVLEETEEHVGEERRLEAVPAEQLETREKLLVESLFCCGSCGFIG